MEPNSSMFATQELEREIRSLASCDPQALEGNSRNNVDCEGNINNNIDNTQQSIRRGRPRGSKNKRKDNPVVYEDTDEAMLPHVVQVEHGADIVQSLRQFYLRLRVGGIYVMSATGIVADLTISMADSVTCFPGIFDILTLSGCFLPHCNSLTLVASNEIKVISGTVEGILLAVGPVHIIVGSCGDPSLHVARLTTRGGEGNGISGHPGPPFSEAIEHTPSLDSSAYNASPSGGISYQTHADGAWLANPHAPGRS